MTIPLRRWARPSSAAARLAACEQLIGHEFNNLDLLKQALDGRKLSSKRLAVIGDAAANTHLAHRWWKKKALNGTQWGELRTSVLCNENLSNVGFRIGINECTIPDSCDTNMRIRMATTIEALLAAVWLDTDRDAAAFDKVMDRLGLTHALIDAGTMRAWRYNPIASMRTLPSYFFSGHHILLTKALSELLQPIIALSGSTSKPVRLDAGEASPKPESEPKTSEAPSDYHAERPKSNGSGVERAKDDPVTVQAHIPKIQSTEGSASSDLDTKEGTQGDKQIVHDENPLLRVNSSDVNENVEVERSLPSDGKADPSRAKRLHIQGPEPYAHQDTGTGGDSTKDSNVQDDEAARKQDMQILETRVQKLIKKQKAKPNPSRLEVLDKLIAQLKSMEEDTMGAVRTPAVRDDISTGAVEEPIVK